VAIPIWIAPEEPRVAGATRLVVGSCDRRPHAADSGLSVVDPAAELGEKGFPPLLSRWCHQVITVMRGLETRRGQAIEERPIEGDAKVQTQEVVVERERGGANGRSDVFVSGQHGLSPFVV